MTIHEAIDHAMRRGNSDVGTNFFDGVIAPTNDEGEMSPDISQHVPFVALFYHGNPEMVKTIFKVWQTAAYRHWGFWLKHEPESTTLKLYTIRNEHADVNEANETLWFIREDYKPHSDGATRFWKALTATNNFVLMLRDKNVPVPTIMTISLRRVANDEFAATEVSELPPELAINIDNMEDAHGRAN